MNFQMATAFMLNLQWFEGSEMDVLQPFKCGEHLLSAWWQSSSLSTSKSHDQFINEACRGVTDVEGCHCHGAHRTSRSVQCAMYAARSRGFTAVPVIHGMAAVLTIATRLQLHVPLREGDSTSNHCPHASMWRDQASCPCTQNKQTLRTSPARHPKAALLLSASLSSGHLSCHLLHLPKRGVRRLPLKFRDDRSHSCCVLYLLPRNMLQSIPQDYCVPEIRKAFVFALWDACAMTGALLGTVELLSHYRALNGVHYRTLLLRITDPSNCNFTLFSGSLNTPPLSIRYVEVASNDCGQFEDIVILGPQNSCAGARSGHAAIG